MRTSNRFRIRAARASSQKPLDEVSVMTRRPRSALQNAVALSFVPQMEDYPTVCRYYLTVYRLDASAPDGFIAGHNGRPG